MTGRLRNNRAKMQLAVDKVIVEKRLFRLDLASKLLR